METWQRQRTNKCDKSDKSFKINSNLMQNRLMQTTVKPYECDNCNKSVTHCVHLKPHQRTQTKVKPYHFD